MIGSLFAVHLLILNHANAVLSRDDCKPDTEIKDLLEYIWWTRHTSRLRNLKLCYEDLGGIQFSNTFIEYSDFRKANLANSNFRGAIISKSDFSNANLSFANFGCLDNNCSVLAGVNFYKANLTGINLKRAVLKNTKFQDANLNDADLSDVKDLTAKQLDKAKLCSTKLPKNLKISGDRDCY